MKYFILLFLILLAGCAGDSDFVISGEELAQVTPAVAPIVIETTNQNWLPAGRWCEIKDGVRWLMGAPGPERIDDNPNHQHLLMIPGFCRS